ncbi:hypothetical protein [Actinoallomurus sp. CA-150999]|uniref:hypothetical protein n=1 Tax=Actinoallomurus sp. CA-150999 TaxID=3239887 RepID=UPI003D930EA4
MIKRLIAGGAATAGVAALALGAFVSPAHADVPCSSKVFNTWYVTSKPTSHECTTGHRTNVGMPNRLVRVIKAGNHGGYLVRRDDGRKVKFKAHQRIVFQNHRTVGLNFKLLHFN